MKIETDRTVVWSKMDDPDSWKAEGERAIRERFDRLVEEYTRGMRDEFAGMIGSLEARSMMFRDLQGKNERRGIGTEGELVAWYYKGKDAATIRVRDMVKALGSGSPAGVEREPRAEPATAGATSPIPEGSTLDSE